MRLDLNGQDGDVTDGNGVFTEDPTVPNVPERPLVGDLPETQVVPVGGAVEGERERLVRRIIRATVVPPLPSRSNEEIYDN